MLTKPHTESRCPTQNGVVSLAEIVAGVLEDPGAMQNQKRSPVDRGAPLVNPKANRNYLDGGFLM